MNPMLDVHVEIAAETLFKIGPLEFTNSMLTMFIVMGLLLFVGWFIARKAQTVPGRGQSVAEMIVEFLLQLVEGTAGKSYGRRIFPLVGSLFIFIIFANYSGLLPGVGTIGFYEDEETTHVETTTTEEHEGEGEAAAATASEPEEEHERVLVPYFRAPNADLNMTLAMALVTFTVVQVAGVRANGIRGRIKHMADPPFLFPIELVSELSRIISLSARLFGNVFAGEVLLAVMYAMANAIKIAVIPLLFPVIFLFLELLFGAVQALVFALLTLIYISLAAAHGGHEEEEEHGHGQAEPARGHAAASAGD